MINSFRLFRYEEPQFYRRTELQSGPDQVVNESLGIASTEPTWLAPHHLLTAPSPLFQTFQWIIHSERRRWGLVDFILTRVCLHNSGFSPPDPPFRRNRRSHGTRKGWLRTHIIWLARFLHYESTLVSLPKISPVDIWQKSFDHSSRREALIKFKMDYKVNFQTVNSTRKRMNATSRQHFTYTSVVAFCLCRVHLFAFVTIFICAIISNEGCKSCNQTFVVVRN